MRAANIFLLFLIAPVVGLLIALSGFVQLSEGLLLPVQRLEPAVGSLEREMHQVNHQAGFVRQSVEEQEEQYAEQQRILAHLAQKSQQQKQFSDEVYEQRILDQLGSPIREHLSARVEVKVFKLEGIGYRGVMAKVKPFDPRVLKVVHEQGPGETTSAAVRRTGAILGINGGGFYRVVQDGKTYTLPIGNTMVDGKLVGGFQPSREDIFFAGFNDRGKLVGGICHDRNYLNSLGARQGASFVPILIQNQRPVPIPAQWKNTRHPRTVLGEYANGNLLLIVVDGRQSPWSSGVTLEDLQITLIQFGIINAYNLDGGGSSVMVFKNEIMNRPSDKSERAMATSIVVLP